MDKKRVYGSDGRAKKDIDMTNHGNAKNHPKVPHEHTWKYDKNGNPIRGKGK